MKERQRKRKYAKAKERARQVTLQRIRTLEMLLGATWDNAYQCFMKQEYDEMGRSVTTTFYDKDGGVIKDLPQYQYQRDISQFIHGG